MTTLILIRHGETYYNVDPAHHLDGLGRHLPLDCYRPPTGTRVEQLNPRGRKQAEYLAQALKPYPIDLCFRSPALRVEETLEPYLQDYLKRKGQPLPCYVRADLQEHDAGDMSTADTPADPRPAWKASGRDDVDFRWPGGESINDLLIRVSRVVDEMLSYYNGRTILVGGHGGMNGALLSILFRDPTHDYWQKGLFHQPNACINLLSIQGRTLKGDPCKQGLIARQDHIPPELTLISRPA